MGRAPFDQCSIRLQSREQACSLAPTADVEEAVLMHGTDEEQDGAVTQQPNTRSWDKYPVEGGFMLGSRPNLPEQEDSRHSWVKTFQVG